MEPVSVRGGQRLFNSWTDVVGIELVPPGIRLLGLRSVILFQICGGSLEIPAGKGQPAASDWYDNRGSGHRAPRRYGPAGTIRIEWETAMLPRHFDFHDGSELGWAELNESVPTIAGLARMAAGAFGRSPPDPGKLSREALALLAASQQRGVFELRAASAEFDSSDRLLAVCIETTGDRRWVFKRSGNPRQTLKYLDGFRELCQTGLVLHQLQKEFSLTTSGFDFASRLDPQDFSEEFQFAREEEI